MIPKIERKIEAVRNSISDIFFYVDRNIFFVCFNGYGLRKNVTASPIQTSIILFILSIFIKIIIRHCGGVL